MMDFYTTIENNETAYGQNLRGFTAYVPNAFGTEPRQMEAYYNQIYVVGPDPRFPVTADMVAGAAAYKAVREHEARFKPGRFTRHEEAIDSIRMMAAAEARTLLQRFPLNLDPTIVILSAEHGAHRLFDHERC